MTHIPEEAVPAEVPAEEEVILKISASQEPGYVKRVAGAMGWRLFETGMFKARAIKSQAVSTATKAVAICNQRVQPAGVVLSMELFFGTATGEDEKGTAIEMTIREVDAVKPETFEEYRVSGKQSEDNAPMKLAEAIAAPVKDGKGVTMKCIGPAAVYRAVLASTIARGLIYPNGFDSVVIPNWDSFEGEDGKTISLIKIDFWGKKAN